MINTEKVMSNEQFHMILEYLGPFLIVSMLMGIILGGILMAIHLYEKDDF